MAKLIINPTSSSRREIPLPRTLLSIGRDPSNDLVLPDAMVSRRHAVIECRGSQYYLRDCNSSNGSMVNGDRVSERSLRDGDLVAIGTARLLFREEAEESAGAKVVPHPSAPKLHCPGCKADYRKGDAFCRQCGGPLAPSGPPKAICPSCGTAVPLPAQFCNACGARLPGEGVEVTQPRPIPDEPAPPEPSSPAPSEEAAPERPKEPQPLLTVRAPLDLPAEPPLKPGAGPLKPGAGKPDEAEAPPLSKSSPESRFAPPAPAEVPRAGGPAAAALAEAPAPAQVADRPPPPRPVRMEPRRKPAERSERARHTEAPAAPRAEAAGAARRLLAALADGFILLLAWLLLLTPAAVYWWSRELPQDPAQVPYLPVLLSVLLVALAALLSGTYYVYCWGVRGATVGQRLLGLTVEATDGSFPIGPGRAFVRLAGCLLCAMTLGIGFPLGLHDRVAGTRVSSERG